MTMFWRFGVAGLLLGLLVVLVADLWSHEAEVTAVSKGQTTPSPRQSPTGTSYVAGLPSRSLVANIASDRASDVASVLPVTADVADNEPSRSQAASELDRLDLTRLPRAPSAAVDIEWRETPLDGDIARPSAPSDAQGPAADKYVVPVPRPKKTADPAQAEGPKGTIPEKAPPPRPDILTGEQVAAAQNKLIAIGFDVGKADGRIGARTETAVRQFQSMKGLAVTGRIDGRLLTQLDDELQYRETRRQQELAAAAPPPRKVAPPEPRGLFGSMMGGLQRIMGRDFDSLRRPDELVTYCRTSPDTWIYDFGREAFVYCGNVNAAGATAFASGKPAETAGTQ